MVGQLPLEQPIGVRIPGGQPIKYFIERLAFRAHQGIRARQRFMLPQPDSLCVLHSGAISIGAHVNSRRGQPTRGTSD